MAKTIQRWLGVAPWRHGNPHWHRSTIFLVRVKNSHQEIVQFCWQQSQNVFADLPMVCRGRKNPLRQRPRSAAKVEGISDVAVVESSPCFSHFIYPPKRSPSFLRSPKISGTWLKWLKWLKCHSKVEAMAPRHRLFMIDNHIVIIYSHWLVVGPPV